MDPELKELLRQNLEISKETNEMLRDLHSKARWGRIFRILYWVIIIGTTLGVFYYLKGPLEQILGVYKGLLSATEKVQNVPDAQAFQDFFRQFGN